MTERTRYMYNPWLEGSRTGKHTINLNDQAEEDLFGYLAYLRSEGYKVTMSEIVNDALKHFLADDPGLYEDSLPKLKRRRKERNSRC